MNFKYKAMTDSGSAVSGVVAAENEHHARQLIAAKGYIPQSVKAGGRAKGEAAEQPEWMEAINRKLAKVKAQDLMLFTKQMKTMIDAGIPTSRMLDILEQQTENLKLKHAAIRMNEDIRQGASLYRAFAAHPSCFSPLFCAMIRAGEISGNLSQVLERLAYLIEHEFKIVKQIKSALTYPTVVVVILIGAFFFLLTFVLPRFIKLFLAAGLELPWPTRVCMALHKGVTEYWLHGLVIFVAVVFGLISYCKTPRGRLHRDIVFLKIPLIGTVLRKSAMSRFTSIFAILQSSGVSVLESVGIISSTIGNSAISRDFDHLEDKLKEGRGISAPLRSSKYFTPMVINMIAIGEESGNLDDLLTQTAKHYDYEVEYSVNRMADLITPIMTLGLAGVVGFFVLSIMLPIFDLIKLVHK